MKGRCPLTPQKGLGPFEPRDLVEVWVGIRGGREPVGGGGGDAIEQGQDGLAPARRGGDKE